MHSTPMGFLKLLPAASEKEFHVCPTAKAFSIGYKCWLLHNVLYLLLVASRNSTASRLPVDAPDRILAVVFTSLFRVTVTVRVGFPREFKVSSASNVSISAIVPSFPAQAAYCYEFDYLFLNGSEDRQAESRPPSFV